MSLLVWLHIATYRLANDTILERSRFSGFVDFRFGGYQEGPFAYRDSPRRFIHPYQFGVERSGTGFLLLTAYSSRLSCFICRAVSLCAKLNNCDGQKDKDS